FADDVVDDAGYGCIAGPRDGDGEGGRCGRALRVDDGVGDGAAECGAFGQGVEIALGVEAVGAVGKDGKRAAIGTGQGDTGGRHGHTTHFAYGQGLAVDV